MCEGEVEGGECVVRVENADCGALEERGDAVGGVDVVV